MESHKYVNQYFYRIFIEVDELLIYQYFYHMLIRDSHKYFYHIEKM